MNGLYEATALALRYWFIVVAVIIVLGVTSISIKEYRDKRMVLDVAQSSIGYLAVISGPEDVMGENVPLLEKNTIGRSRSADIMFADRSVDKAHSQIYQCEDGTVKLSRLGRGDVTVNGVNVQDNVPLRTQDTVCFGNVVAKVFLKEG
mgnify:CR=1 FL=1